MYAETVSYKRCFLFGFRDRAQIMDIVLGTWWISQHLRSSAEALQCERHKLTFLRTECWKMCVCRCQTRVMIAAISLETGRNVFTNQPNVTPAPSDPRVRSPCCWSNIYLFIYFRFFFSSPAKRKEIELFFCFFFNKKVTGCQAQQNKSIGLDVDWIGNHRACGECLSMISRGFENCARFVRISESVQTHGMKMSLSIRTGDCWNMGKVKKGRSKKANANKKTPPTYYL